MTDGKIHIKQFKISIPNQPAQSSSQTKLPNSVYLLNPHTRGGKALITFCLRSVLRTLPQSRAPVLGLLLRPMSTSSSSSCFSSSSTAQLLINSSFISLQPTAFVLPVMLFTIWYLVLFAHHALVPHRMLVLLIRSSRMHEQESLSAHRSTVKFRSSSTRPTDVPCHPEAVRV